jgi:hypothetical protein
MAETQRSIVDVVCSGAGATAEVVTSTAGTAHRWASVMSPPGAWKQRTATVIRRPQEAARRGGGVEPESHIVFIEQWIDDDCPDQDAASTFTWSRTGDQAGSRHGDVWFLTPDLGWAVNSDGKILGTADGGNRWEQQFLTSGRCLRCVGFASESQGWVGTPSPARPLLETSDGGVTWNNMTNLPEFAPSAVCGLSVVDESVVYALGTRRDLDRLG